MKRNILVIHDHAIQPPYLELLGRDGNFCLCGIVDTIAKALKTIPKAFPDLVIIDIRMEGIHGIEAVREIKSWKPDVLVVVISDHAETIFGERALRAGAKGYLERKDVATCLIPALYKVMEGGFFVSEDMNTRILLQYMGHPSHRTLSPMERLSEREIEVFEWLGRGLSTREIAEVMHISPKTVETHRGHLKSKLDIDTSAHLVRRAIQWVSGEPAE